MDAMFSPHAAATVARARQHSVGDLLHRSAARYPDKLAVVAGDLRVSYAEFDAAVNRTAHALAGRGRNRGRDPGLDRGGPGRGLGGRRPLVAVRRRAPQVHHPGRYPPQKPQRQDPQARTPPAARQPSRRRALSRRPPRSSPAQRGEPRGSPRSNEVKPGVHSLRVAGLHSLMHREVTSVTPAPHRRTSVGPGGPPVSLKRYGAPPARSSAAGIRARQAPRAARRGLRRSSRARSGNRPRCRNGCAAGRERRPWTPRPRSRRP